MTGAPPAPSSGWRVFPWDPQAAHGAPFSARFIPPAQGSGRFDLGSPLVLYLAESPAHAVGEILQSFRGRHLGPAHLLRFGRPLAVVKVGLPPGLAARIADLTDPAILAHHEIRPDALASRDVQRTQALSRALHDAGVAGFRWWSSLSGDWHALVLYLDRVPLDDLTFDPPEPLSLAHPAVREASVALGIRLAGRGGTAGSA